MLTKIWDNHWAREAILFVVSALATQFAFSAADLLSVLQTAHDWKELWADSTAWLNAFLFAFVITLIKQVVAAALAWRANRTLAGPKST